MRRGLVFLVALSLLTGTFAWAQQEPEPYDPEEFPKWLRDLRRGEIIAIGSFPITFVFANLTYGLIRFGLNGWDNSYSPIGNPDRVPYTNTETLGVITAAVGLAVTVALIDFARGRTGDRP